jgi:hypothetical protein
MDVVVAPLLHSREPANPEAVNTELPQLLEMLTAGAGIEAFKGCAMPLPIPLVQPFIV